MYVAGVPVEINSVYWLIELSDDTNPNYREVFKNSARLEEIVNMIARLQFGIDFLSLTKYEQERVLFILCNEIEGDWQQRIRETITNLKRHTVR